MHFIVDSRNDPAYERLKRAGVENIVVAGPAQDCGQKVHNLRYAIEHAAAADIYAFCDSDARYPRHWLRRLTASLTDGTASVSSGYRWYVANHFHIPTLLRSAWNAAWSACLATTAATSHGADRPQSAARPSSRQGAGSLARLRLRRLRDHARVSTSGTKIKFVPECLIPSHGDAPFRSFWNSPPARSRSRAFTTPDCGASLSSHRLSFSATFLGIAMFSNLTCAILGLRFTSCPPQNPIRLNGFVRFSRIKAHPLRLVLYLYFSRWAYLYLYNMVRSASTTEIVWRQIHYKLISPNETHVFGGSAASGS